MRKMAIMAVTILSLVFGGVSAAWGSATSSPAARYTGQWTGLTGQGKVIKFHVTTRNRIDKAVLKMKIPFQNCGGSVTFTMTATFARPVPIVDARFHFHAGVNPRVSVTGHFRSATRAAGSMTGSFNDTISGCHGTKTTSWTAHKVT